MSYIPQKYRHFGEYHVDLDDDYQTSLKIVQNPVNPSKTDVFWIKEGWNGHNILFSLSQDELDEFIAGLESRRA